MTAAKQLTLAPTPTLPLDPHELLGLDPAERGLLYNEVDLDFQQRACAEEALRTIARGEYRENAR